MILNPFNPSCQGDWKNYFIIVFLRGMRKKSVQGVDVSMA